MFQPGDKIIYSGHGVCEVKEVCHPPVRGIDPGKLYYKLSPVYGTEDIYVPVRTEIFMRPAMTREEAEQLLRRLPRIKEKSYHSPNHNVAQARLYYNSILSTHNCVLLLGLWKGFHGKMKGGKKLGLIDGEYMKRIEDLLCGELSVALDVSLAEAADRIKSAAL